MKTFSPAMEALSSCPVCSSKRWSISHRPDICRCDDCKVHFRNPRPNQDAIIACYDKGVTFRQWQNELDIRSKLWKKRLSLILSYRQSGSLLDIGTGDGYFLNFIKNIFNAEAIEVSEYGVRHAETLGHAVHHGSVFDSEFDERKYDIVTMWHVLEHLPDPGKVMHRVMELLQPDGLLFIAVPNEISSLYSPTALRKINPFGRLSCDEEIHLTHFTPHVLIDVLQHQHGLDVLELRVDDVHVYRRKHKLPFMYINKVLGKLLRFHFDAAMLVVCSRPQTSFRADET